MNGASQATATEDSITQDAVIEVAVVVDSEAAEAVSELFNRYNGGHYDDDSEAGEASGGGAVIEATGFDDFDQPLDGEHQLIVKTYVKPGLRGQEVQRQIEEGLGHLSMVYPIPEAQIREVRQEDWAHAWKKFYKPLRVGRRVVLKPVWEDVETQEDDIVVELDPGMAFGTGMHPTTRLCIAALEKAIKPGDALLDVGTGSGILSIVGARLGASSIVATDIDPIALQVTKQNVELNGLGTLIGSDLLVELGSVPADMAGRFPVMVANILAEVIVKLFDSAYDNAPLAEPLAPGGRLILSGIIDTKAEMVFEAAQRHGLTLSERLQETDWVALVMRKEA